MYTYTYLNISEIYIIYIYLYSCLIDIIIYNMCICIYEINTRFRNPETSWKTQEKPLCFEEWLPSSLI